MSDVIEMQCDHCSAMVENVFRVLVRGRNAEDWCADCESESFICDSCTSIVDETQSINTDAGEREFCTACQETHAMQCTDCGTPWSRYSEAYYVPNGTIFECCANQYSWCTDCNEIDEECTCDNYRESSSDNIYPYGYKPDPVFHPEYPTLIRMVQVRGSFDPARVKVVTCEGKSIDRSSLLQFGIELEVECDSGARSGDADWLSQLYDDNDLYLKADGSLSNGFEIVTQPRSLESWRKFALIQPEVETFGSSLLSLRNRGVRSWDNDNCGLHIHISRIAFNGRPHLARFALLFGQNAPDWVRVAGRQSGYASFNGLRDGGLVKKARLGAGSHSDAVNFSGRETVEVRIWRPSLMVERVVACIEFSHAAVEYTRNLTVADVSNGALDWRPFSKYVLSNNYPLAQRVLGGETFRTVRQGA